MFLKNIAVILFLVNVITWTEATTESSTENKEQDRTYLNLLHQNEASTANSEAIFNAISQLSEKRQSQIKRNLFKRIQVPFKWGKRSSTTNQELANNLDQCADLFIILLGPNRDELTRFDRGELKTFFDVCFSTLIDSLFATNTASSNEALDDQVLSSKSDFVTKRSNVPFKWG